MSKSKPLTELRDAEITRVDAVKGAANGTRFLIAKAAADGPAGLVSPEEVRDLIAEPAEDTYLYDATAPNEVIKATKQEENPMTAPADQIPAEAVGPTPEDARAILKQAKRDRRVAKLEKRVAKAKATAAPPAAPGGEPEPDADDAPMMKTVSLKKAKAEAKAARLAKRAARDRIAVAKANRTLVKIGRRNSGDDQNHIDAADTHIAALGATIHAPADIAKAAEEQVAGVIELIQKAVGPMLEQDRTAIRTELTQVSEGLAKVLKTAQPGGPRVVMDRDGSIIGAPDGEAGLSFEQAAILKVAERYPVGSVAREELQKAAATSAIKELMVARQQY